MKNKNSTFCAISLVLCCSLTSACASAGNPVDAPAVVAADGQVLNPQETAVNDLITDSKFQEARALLAGKKSEFSAADFAYWNAKIGFSEAKAEYEQALSAQMGRVIMTVYLADESKAPPKVKSALESINQAIGADPKRPQFYLLRSDLYGLAQMPVHQISDLTQVIALDPTNADAYVKRADVWKHGSQFYEPAELESCTNPDVKASLKKTWREHRDSDAAKVSDAYVRELALKDYDKAIEVQPKADAAYFERSEMRKDKGDLKGAIADCEKFVELSRNEPMREHLGELYMADGQHEKALEIFTKYLKDFPMDRETFAKRAECYKKLGKVAEADADIKSSKEAYDPSEGK